MFKHIISILAVFIFVILALGSAGKQEPAPITQVNSTKISLIKHLPSDLEVSENNIVLNKYLQGNNSKYSHGGLCTVSDENITFNISLTRSSVESGSRVELPVVFNVEVVNKTNEPIRIKWDEVSYIDGSGTAHGVVKTGVRFLDKAQPIGDIVIPPQSKTSEIIHPSDFIYYKKGRYGGWRSHPVVDNISTDDVIGIFLPIEIQDTIINYNFTFKAIVDNQV